MRTIASEWERFEKENLRSVAILQKEHAKHVFYMSARMMLNWFSELGDIENLSNSEQLLQAGMYEIDDFLGMKL